MIYRYSVFFVACALPFLLVGQFAPSMAHELDFWALWLVAMTLVGLPVLFAEFALSAKSGDGVWLGMQKLTREADAKLFWRAFAGLSVFLSMLICASITARIGVGLGLHLPQAQLGVPPVAVGVSLMVVALILSLLKARLLLVGLVITLIGAMISLFDGGLSSQVAVPIMTQVSLAEWGQAVLLALLSVGVGSGLYWFVSVGAVSDIYQHKKSLSGFIIPVWLSQLIFGSVALLVGSAFVTPTSFLVSALGMVLIASFLVYYATSQLTARFGLVSGAGMAVVGLLVLSALPLKVVQILLVLASLTAVALLAIFSGFVMKISHLRKTFNFASEGRYNLWRMLVRIVVPLAVVLALVGWVMSWIA